MTDEEKLKVFEYFIEKIQTPSIKEYTKFCLLNIPDYFYTLPASSTGFNHGKNETLISHVLGCLFVGEQVCDGMFKTHWTQRQKDQLYSALMLHDSYRCGPPNEECRITQELINEKGLDQSLLGNLKTSREHPIVGWKQLLRLGIAYNHYADENKLERIGENNLSAITKAVKYHYGVFLEIKEHPYSLSWPFDTVTQQVVAIDFHNTMNTMYFTRSNINK